MISVLRTLPGFAAAFLLGALVMSPGFEQLPTAVKQRQIGLIIAAGVILTLLLVAVTRRKPQEQKQPAGFGRPARNRTGR